jgi:hypothetical protein
MNFATVPFFLSSCCLFLDKTAHSATWVAFNFMYKMLLWSRATRPYSCSLTNSRSHQLPLKLKSRSSRTPSSRKLETCTTSSSPLDIKQAAEKYGWGAIDATTRPADFSGNRQIMEIPLAAIRRPLQGSRTNSRSFELNVETTVYLKIHYPPLTASL